MVQRIIKIFLDKTPLLTRFLNNGKIKTFDMVINAYSLQTQMLRQGVTEYKAKQILQKLPPDYFQ